MSAIKLDPANDLGLSSDPSFTTSTNTYSDPSSNPQLMGGISDINSFSAPSAPVVSNTAQTMSTPNVQTAALSQQMPVMTPVMPEAKSDMQSFDIEENSKGGNILFLLSVLLFCASLGVVIYFALRYFAVI